ncbi:MAG: GNAT family N-acetyltransferase, partial [Bosea sp. (in: a-proteobacteria)]
SMSMSGTWAQLAYADDREAVAGFSLIRLVLNQAELLLVAVRRDCRGTGVGQALMNDAMALARRQGAEEMFLEVRDGNASALGLYRSHGFAVVGHRRGYYSGAMTERFDAITMQRSI